MSYFTKRFLFPRTKFFTTVPELEGFDCAPKKAGIVTKKLRPARKEVPDSL